MFDADSFRIAVQEELKKYGYWYDVKKEQVGDKLQILIFEDGGVHIYRDGVQSWNKQNPKPEKVAKKANKLLKHPIGPPGPPGPPGPVGLAGVCKCKCKRETEE